MTEPVIAQKKPVIVELEAGKEYWWCACGRSKTQPFCDGSHQGTGIEPLGFREDKGGKRGMCCCKRTTTPPYCDGTHKALGD
jgi:CDGSH-type Zn-finger protein